MIANQCDIALKFSKHWDKPACHSSGAVSALFAGNPRITTVVSAVLTETGKFQQDPLHNVIQFPVVYLVLPPIIQS